MDGSPSDATVIDRGDAADAAFMARAVELAEGGWGRVAPNPLVGAVVVRDGTIVGEGFHCEYGQPHAEVEAIRTAGDAARGATIYVTLEPCAHTGKTPPCTEAIAQAGIRRVVYACDDPNPQARGGGEVLREAGLRVDRGAGEAAARALNGPFFRAHTPGAPDRPWLELKLALSLDARIADRDRKSVWITGDAARQETHRLRAGHDAIAVGIGTALADDPVLTVRGPVQPRVPPVRIVFDHTARLPLDGRLLGSLDEAPVWVVCSPDADGERRERLEGAGARVVVAANLPDALRALRVAGILSIFCEGGAALASSLLRGDLVDRLTLVRAPILLGPGGLDPFAGIPSPTLDEVARWRHVRAETLGEDTLVTVDRR